MRCEPVRSVVGGEVWYGGVRLGGVEDMGW